MADLAKLITSKSIPVTESGCWIWLAGERGSKYLKYGNQSVGGKCFQAHRLSYMAFRGEIPTGMHVCHKCDTPLCVNPDHLWLGTNKQNSDDKVRKRRHNIGTRHGSCKLDPEKVRVIRASSESNLSLARANGVTTTLIGYIKKRKIWKHVL